MATSPIVLTPTGLPPYQVVSGRLLEFPVGAWLADLELSADSVQKNGGTPSGKVVVLFGGVPLTGTIDPTASGSFGPTARVRVVAGGGGWGNVPPAQEWHADNGVLSTTVYAATAAAVGEIVNDVVPAYFSGVDFVRSGDDPASSVFRDAQWWVDFFGVTQVGPRPPGTVDPSFVLRDWDPINRKATFSSDTILQPNTTLVDPRFNGLGPTVQTVEQVFDAHGSIGWAWASAGPVSLIVNDLKAAALYWTRASLLRHYRYRLITYQGDGPGGPPSRMALQACTPTAGAPDLIPLLPTFGAAGLVSTLSPGQEVLVAFENADPTKAWIVSYSPVGTPLTNALDAIEEVDLGKSAALVNIAGGQTFLATAPGLAGAIAAVAAFAGACSTSTDPVLVTAAAGLVTALGGLGELVSTLRTRAT